VLRGNLLLTARQAARQQAQAVATQLATPGAKALPAGLAAYGVERVTAVPKSPIVLSVTAPNDRTTVMLTTPSTKYALATEQVPSATGPARMVTAGVSLRPAESALHTVMWMLVPGVPLLLMLVAAVTWCVAGRAMRPVAAITNEVAVITASDLHRRVPVPRAQDEIRELATTMNTTLDRLERASDRQLRFVADASHEFRSPLATLRTRLELAQLNPRTWPDVTAEALADTERLQHLADDLLLLARLDAGEPAKQDQVDLAQVAAEEVTRRRPHPHPKINLDLEPDVIVHGSRAHLGRLLTNLLDNAVRHAESTVTIRVATDKTHALLEVADDGAGIPEADRERIFDRFTRLDAARSRDEGGAGLGLAIARDIAVRHHGTLTATNPQKGARLVTQLPTQKPKSKPQSFTTPTASSR
jgi:signal transduction histidine kinase